MAVATFLNSFDFTGKVILPFCTNEGSGMGSSVKDLKKNVPGAEIRDGMPINGSRAADSKDAAMKWLRANGLI